MNTTEVHKINKEDISRMPIISCEVTSNKEEQLRRRLNLQKAVWLGNTQKHKVTLCFQSDQEWYEVQTTIWSVTDTHVGLKGGVVLPVANIQRVDLC